MVQRLIDVSKDFYPLGKDVRHASMLGLLAPVGPTVVATLLAHPGVAGTGSSTGLLASELDLLDDTAIGWHRNVFVAEVATTNGQGSTPTSPGADATITLNIAFSSQKLSAASDAPTILGAVKSTLTCTLKNTSASTAAGKAVYQSPSLQALGKYLYAWLDKSAFASNASVAVTARLIAI